MLASLVQALGIALLTVAALLAWGVPPALGVAGAGLLAFGVAAELPRPKADE